MVNKWPRIAVLLATLFSTAVKADNSTDCMDLYGESPVMGDCTLTLNGVEKINQVFMTNKDYKFLILWDVHMEEGVSESLVNLLEKNNQVSHFSLYNTNFAATELQHLAQNDHLLSVDLVENNFDEANFLTLAANKSIESFLVGEQAVSMSALSSFLDVHPIKSFGLQGLTLSETDLQELFTKHSDFNSLELINLHINTLNALSQLNTLETLKISSMHISNEDMAHIATLKRLQVINMTSTDITPSGANQLAQLKNLEIVIMDNYPMDMNDNSVGDEGIRFIKELPHLKSVSLRHQNLSKEGAVTISQNKNLTEVMLPDNKLGDEGAISLSFLPNLEELDLAYNDIGDRAAAMIANNNSITRINLQQNHIGDIGGVALANKTNLSHLNIMSNQLTDITAHAFANRTSPLKQLIVYNNLFSQAAIDALYCNPNIEYLGAGDFLQLKRSLNSSLWHSKQSGLKSNGRGIKNVLILQGVGLD